MTLGLVAVGCGADTSSVPTTDSIPATSPTTEGRDDAATSTLPERVPPTMETLPESDPPAVGEVPQQILDEILVDAAARTGLSAGDFTVRRSQAMTWSDGSLGCPVPGEFYTQAIVDGYWVELVEPDGTVLDYRVGDSGYFKLCEGLTTPHSGGTTGETGTNPES